MEFYKDSIEKRDADIFTPFVENKTTKSGYPFFQTTTFSGNLPVPSENNKKILKRVFGVYNKLPK